MLYQRKSFQVPATNGGNTTMCDTAGHAMPDVKARCIRCGERMTLNEVMPHAMASFQMAYENAVANGTIAPLKPANGR